MTTTQAASVTLPSGIEPATAVTSSRLIETRLVRSSMKAVRAGKMMPVATQR